MTPSRSTATHSFWAEPATIIGIDPGLARTGIGVIRREGSRSGRLAHQVVRSAPSEGVEQRLAAIHAAVLAACLEHQPAIAAVERTFVNTNPGSSLALSQARGAALAALGAAGVPVQELAPSTVKKQVGGRATAAKAEVARMVRSLLELPAAEKLAADAADALAIALSASGGRQALTARRPRGRRRRRR
ncbi:MAG: crossover junction endodeoxyribonuclease RuvC [Betaproteobacteria bacterium AqS2]|uniref:Crossover junction endodeoxyribonuclease RuvC n=1 Tax=Candidatus Amphirhobacter heronislandensis TaxID=1732024 RepID=A0A930XVY6_9GAMM|nr:crossover junction endodeoxyribonuclease RuvC [Betaproteobacteria bacterium AqS2]